MNNFRSSVREREERDMGRGPLRFAFALVATFVCLLGASTASAQAPATKVLVFHGAPNDTVNAGVAAIQALGASNDFAVTTSQSASDFTAANLEQYRAIVF